MMKEWVEIAFPGLGIDTFRVNKIAFTVFGVEIRWYGILITLGMILAFCYALYRARQEGFRSDDVLDMGLFMIIFGVIGARLYYVVMKWDDFYVSGRSFWENLKSIFNIRGGGLAIYGGVIAGALVLILYCRIKKLNWRGGCDMVVPGVMIAQALGRWGNFCNGEAYGGIVSEGSPLYFLRMGLSPNIWGREMAYVHPTFLYESVWNLAGFCLIHFLLYPRKKFNGEVALSYFAWYGFGRMLIEGLREDSLYIGTVRVSQLVGFLCFVVATAMIVGIRIWIHRHGTVPARMAITTPEVGTEVQEPALPAHENAVSDSEISGTDHVAPDSAADTAERDERADAAPEQPRENTQNKTDAPDQ